jgi:type IV pilus assembly protein PilB
MPIKKIIQKQLGELLIEGKLITPEHLDEALKLQKEKGGLLGQILVSLGYTTEEAIAQALTAQYGFPYLPLGGYEIDREVAKLIPENVARQYGLIAVDRVGSILTVAMSNPLNTQATEDIEMMTRLKVQVFVSTATDVNDAIKRCYKA